MPRGALILCLGLDCQLDRVEWALWGFGREYKRFAIDFGVVQRHISEPNCQRNLDLLLDRRWPNFCGHQMGVSLASVDGNYSTDDVLQWARKYSQHRLIVVRGVQSDVAPRIAKVARERDEKRGQVRKHGGRFFNLNVSNFKMSLYRDLEKTDPAMPGYVSLQELVAETRIAVKRLGYTICA